MAALRIRRYVLALLLPIVFGVVLLLNRLFLYLLHVGLAHPSQLLGVIPALSLRILPFSCLLFLSSFPSLLLCGLRLDRIGIIRICIRFFPSHRFGCLGFGVPHPLSPCLFECVLPPVVTPFSWLFLLVVGDLQVVVPPVSLSLLAAFSSSSCYCFLRCSFRWRFLLGGALRHLFASYVPAHPFSLAVLFFLSPILLFSVFFVLSLASSVRRRRSFVPPIVHRSTFRCVLLWICVVWI